MKANRDLVIVGERVVLVPYREVHVQTYHEWMKSEELRAQTASEPLTLDEEYAMQRSWEEDENKCTFIVLDPDVPDGGGTGRQGGAMAGDVNLFIDKSEPATVTAEVSFMVAETRSRRKGIATEALMLVMAFGVTQLNVTTYVAKVQESNQASICCLLKLGFREVKRVPVFGEIHLELAVNEGVARERLVAVAASMRTRAYEACRAAAASAPQKN